MSEHTGVMIALAVPSPERYALDPASAGIPEGAEVTPAPELHLTLAFLGPSEDLSPEQVEALRDACRALSEQETAPTALFPASAGVFPPDPDQAVTQDGHTYEQPVAPFWLAPQPVDPFHALRESMMTHLAARGVADLVSTRHPVFNPHVTLAYVPLGAPPLAELPTPVPVEFSDLVLAVGGVWEVYPLLRTSDASATPPPLTASVESALRHVSASAPGFSADLLRAVYLRQRPALSPVASRSDQALEAVRAYVRETTRQGLTAATLALPGWDPASLGAKAPRLSDLINRAAIEPDPAQRALVLGRALALAARIPGRDGDAVRTRLRSLVADGNSSAARSMRARKQLRDGKGRWIEMGGGVRFKVRSPGAASQWYHGTVEGIDVPNGLVQVRLDDAAGENAGKLVNVPNKMLDQPKALLGWRPKSAGKKGTAAPAKRPWSPDRPVVRGPGAAEAPSTWAGLRDWLSGKTKVTLDTETTGFDVEDGTDLPVQLAATRVRPDGTEDSFNTLVNPGKPIPEQSSAIHGITDDMVAGAPSPAEAFAQFQDWASQSDDNVLVAHNMNFDESAVASMSPEAKAYLDGATTLDTFRLARAAVPKTDQGGPTASHGLATLAPAMGVDTGKSHTADADAKAASDLLPKLLDYAVDNNRPSAALSGLPAQNTAFDKDWPGYLAALSSYKESGAEPEAMTDPNAPEPDSEAIAALESIHAEVTAKHPDAKVSGGNIVNLVNDPNLKAAEADSPGQDAYTFTASRNPIKDAPVTLQASDIASVRESVSRITEGNMPDGFDALPEEQKKAAARAAAGKAYSQLASQFNERNEDPELRAAPGVKLADLQEAEAPVTDEGGEDVSDTELADAAMDSLKELQKRVDSKSKFASTRDRVAKSLTTAVDRFSNGDDDRAAFLENVEKIKHFANAQEDMYDSGFAQDNPELAHFSAFAEDLDNVSVAGGAGTSEDRLAFEAASKELGLSPATIESVLDPDMDWGQVTEAAHADPGAAEFFKLLDQAQSDKLNKSPAERQAKKDWDAWTKAYEKLKPNQAKQDVQEGLKAAKDQPARVGDGPLSAEEVQAAFDHEAGKLPHPSSTFYKDGAKNALTNPYFDTDEKRRERLNKLVDQFKDSAGLPEESPRVEALRRAANGFGSPAEDAPETPEAPAGVPEAEVPGETEAEVPGEPEDYGYEDTPIGSAWAARDEVYGAVADALTPEGSDEQADSFPEPVATAIDEFQSTLEAWDTLPEDADSLGGYSAQVKERGDALVQALAGDTSIPQQKVEAVQKAVDDFSARTEEAADVADSPEEPEAPEAPAPAEDTNAARFLGVFDRIKDIAKDEPALSEPLGAIGNAVANIGKELQSGSLSASQGGKLLDGLVTEIDNLYADDLYADALDGTDAGDDLDSVRDDVLTLAKDAKDGKLGGGSGSPAAEDGETGPSEELFDAVAAHREALGDLAEVSPAPKNQPGKKALAAWSETLDNLEAGVAVDKAEAQQQLDDLVKALEADSWGKKGKTYTDANIAPVQSTGQELVDLVPSEQAEAPEADAPEAAPEPEAPVEQTGWMGEDQYETLRDEALLHAPLFVDDPDMTESDTELVRSIDQAFDDALSADELAGIMLELADHVESGMLKGQPEGADEAMWADKGQDAIDWLRGTAAELSPDAAVAEGVEPTPEAGPDLLEAANPESLPEPGEFTGEGALSALEYTEDVDGIDLDAKLQQAIDMRNEGELDNGQLADAVEGIRANLLERYGENAATKWIGDYLTSYAGELRSMKDKDLPPADQEGEPSLDTSVTAQNLATEIDSMVAMLQDEPDFESGQGAGWEPPTEAIDAAQALQAAFEDARFQLDQGSMTPQAAADQVDAAYDQLNDAYLDMTEGEGELPAFLSNAVYAYTESIGGGSGESAAAPAAPYDPAADPWANYAPVVEASLAKKADDLAASENPVVQAVSEELQGATPEDAEAIGDFLGWAASGDGFDETAKAELFDAAEELDGVGDGPGQDEVDAMYDSWSDEVFDLVGAHPDSDPDQLKDQLTSGKFWDWLAEEGGFPSNDADQAADLWVEAFPVPEEPEIPDTPEQASASAPSTSIDPDHDWAKYNSVGQTGDGEEIDYFNALYAYAGDYSDDINAWLRDPEGQGSGASGSIPEWAADLDEMMEHSTTDQDVAAYRIAQGDSAAGWVKALAEAQVGETVVDQGFASTAKGEWAGDPSYSPPPTWDGKPQTRVTFVIDVPAGTRALDVNQAMAHMGGEAEVPGENELLLDRGTGFEVLERTATEDGRGIMLRVRAVQNAQTYTYENEEAADVEADGAADDGGGAGAPGGDAGPAEAVPGDAGGAAAGQLGELTDLSQPLHDVDSWEKVGGNLGGGSIGGTFKDADGNAYYVKKPDSPAHAHNEVLHSLLERDLGVRASVVELGTQNGQLVIVSKWVPGNEGAVEGKSVGLAADKIAEGDEAWITEAYNGFTVDAWLANWDAVGPKQNNIVVGKDADGNDVPYRIDGGGAMLFSGFGDPKGAKFGPVVTELESMRNPSRSAGKLFHGMTDEQVKADSVRLATLSPERLMDLINATGHDEQTKADLFLTLSARQASLLSQTGAVKPADPAMETVAKEAQKADAHKVQIEQSAPNPEAADAIAAAETGSEPAQLWVNADGVQLKLGDKVVSAKDGAAGTVVSLSANGKYAKVLPAGQESLPPKDRKYIFRFPHTLKIQGEPTVEWQDSELLEAIKNDGQIVVMDEVGTDAPSEALEGVSAIFQDNPGLYSEDLHLSELDPASYADPESMRALADELDWTGGSSPTNGMSPSTDQQYLDVAQELRLLADNLDGGADPNPFGAPATDLLGKLDQFAFNNAGVESDGVDIGDNAYETYYSVLNGETSPEDGYDILTDMLGDAGESASPTAQADLQAIADGVKELPDLSDQEPLEEDEEAVAEAEAPEVPASAAPDPAGAQEDGLAFHQMTANNMVPGMVNKKDETLLKIMPATENGKPVWWAFVGDPSDPEGQKKLVWKKYSGVGQWATPSAAAPAAEPAPEKTPEFVSGGHPFFVGDEVYAFHGWEQGPAPDMPIAVWRKGVLAKSETFGGYQVTKENGTSLLLGNHEDIMSVGAYEAFKAEQDEMVAKAEAAILENAGMEPGGPDEGLADQAPTFDQQATAAVRKELDPFTESLSGYGDQDMGNDFGNDVSQTLDLLDDGELEPVAAVEDLKAMVEGLKHSTNEDGEELPVDTYQDFVAAVQAMENLVNNPFAFEPANAPAPAAPAEEPLAPWEQELLGLGQQPTSLGSKYAALPAGSKPLFQMTDKVGQDTGPVVVQHADGSLHGYTAGGDVSAAFTTLAKYEANPNWSAYKPGPTASYAEPAFETPAPDAGEVMEEADYDQAAASVALDEIIAAADQLKGFMTEDGTDIGELLSNYASTQKGPSGDNPQDALDLLIGTLDETGNAKDNAGNGPEAEPIGALGAAIENLQNVYKGEAPAAPTGPKVHPANASANLSGPSQMGAYGQTMYVGTKVQSTTDGMSGTIIGFSPDGKYAKVMVPGQAKTKLRYPSKLKYDPNAGGAPAPGAAAEKPGIPGGTMLAPNSIPTPDPGVKYVEGASDPSSPWFGEDKKPEPPAAPETPAAQALGDEWFAKVEASYQDKQGKPLTDSSKVSVYNQAKSGSKPALDTLKNKGWINDELYDEAVQLIEFNLAETQAVLDAHAAQVAQHQSDLAEWAKANGKTGVALQGFEAPGVMKLGVAEAKSVMNNLHKPANLTPSQKAAVQAQKSSSSWQTPLRKTLKKETLDPAKVSQQVKNLDQAVQAAPPLSDDMVMVRTLTPTSFVLPGMTREQMREAANFPKIQGTVQVDWGFPESSPGSMEAGAVPGFQVGNVWMDILMPKGTRGVWTGGGGFSHTGERGFVAERGLAYYIHKAEWRTDLPGAHGQGKWYVQAEVLPKLGDYGGSYYDMFDPGAPIETVVGTPNGLIEGGIAPVPGAPGAPVTEGAPGAEGGGAPAGPAV